MEFEMKWFAIMMIGVIIATMVGVGFEDYSKNQVAIAATGAGLEECPNKDGHKGDTIWVKSCREYLEIVEGSK